MRLRLDWSENMYRFRMPISQLQKHLFMPAQKMTAK